MILAGAILQLADSETMTWERLHPAILSVLPILRTWLDGRWKLLNSMSPSRTFKDCILLPRYYMWFPVIRHTQSGSWLQAIWSVHGSRLQFGGNLSFQTKLFSQKRRRLLKQNKIRPLRPRKQPCLAEIVDHPGSLYCLKLVMQKDTAGRHESCFQHRTTWQSPKASRA